MAKYVLALDQGTTSSRAILFNADGTISRFRFEKGRVHSRHRYVQTERWKLERAAGRWEVRIREGIERRVELRPVPELGQSRQPI